MGAYDAIHDHGLRLPEDDSIVGYDDQIEIAPMLRPALTSVALPHRDMGRPAVDLLLSEEATEPTTHTVACPWPGGDELAEHAPS